MPKRFWVYMLADEPYGTLYIGVTNSLMRRTYEHREGLFEGHAKKHGIKMLAWYAEFPTALEAIAFEKKIKKWKRLWKVELVKKFNPKWLDLYETLNQQEPSFRKIFFWRREAAGKKIYAESDLVSDVKRNKSDSASSRSAFGFALHAE